MNVQTVVFLLTFLGISMAMPAQNIPAGYQLLYQQNFEALAALSDFEFAEKKGWALQDDSQQGKVLALVAKNNYQPRVRSPHSMALIKDHLFGDFIMEVKLKQTGREYNHRDLCLFFNFQGPSNYYYVHMASIADPHAHNIFLVNDEPRVNIGEEVTDGVQWGSDWHQVKIVRKASEGVIEVYFDDMETPIMKAKDTHFQYGQIGFGSFDDTGLIDEVSIWGPGFEQHPVSPFEH